MNPRDRIAACRGMDDDQIGAMLSDLDQEAVTRAAVELIGERTDTARLRLPYVVGLTMYGDADVSEWVLRYGQSGVSVQPGEADDVDADTRWEHWEDAVRALNGDVPTLSLYYARRITMGEEPTTSDEPVWLRAVDFAPGSDVLAMGRVLTQLLDAYESGGGAQSAYVDRVGLGAIAEARAAVVAWALLECGCGHELRGTYWQVACGEASPVANVLISDSDARPSPTPPADDASGIVLRYATVEAMLAEATGARTFQDLLINGLVRLEGGEEDRGRFARSLMSFARLHGI